MKRKRGRWVEPGDVVIVEKQVAYCYERGVVRFVREQRNAKLEGNAFYNCYPSYETAEQALRAAS